MQDRDDTLPHAWGRWGPEDEAGALNLIGPAQVRRAASLVRTVRMAAPSVTRRRQPRSAQTWRALLSLRIMFRLLAKMMQFQVGASS